MIGAGRVNDPGCLTWNELHTPTPPRRSSASTACSAGTRRRWIPEGGPSYTIVKVGERSNGGVMDAQEGEPPNWLPTSRSRAVTWRPTTQSRLGANELYRTDMPQGSKIAIFADPQGAPFGVFEGEIDD